MTENKANVFIHKTWYHKSDEKGSMKDNSPYKWYKFFPFFITGGLQDARPNCYSFFHYIFSESIDWTKYFVLAFLSLALGFSSITSRAYFKVKNRHRPPCWIENTVHFRDHVMVQFNIKSETTDTPLKLAGFHNQFPLLTLIPQYHSFNLYAEEFLTVSFWSLGSVKVIFRRRLYCDEFLINSGNKGVGK